MTTENTAPVEHFVDASRQTGAIWGLHCKDGWVICDSAIYEDTDVMPFWSTREAAEIHCVDEWSEFAPVAIPLEEFVDEWLVDLANDAVMLGPDWGDDLSGEEIEPRELAEKFVLQ
ncbi:hypothetical protein GCE9029_02324 [Grimontia celer]|uniref:DUF2750 domain-containing protein n=1 Tax=Grimontia celer TaxID=1796497 RepID=A0A128F360_9GAMM|nr:DUF2750 domain-containing protein [Grimontia celer]CZF80985.1 hypothetical protein GCE9029_02324 [Grimontia celer]